MASEHILLVLSFMIPHCPVSNHSTFSCPSLLPTASIFKILPILFVHEIFLDAFELLLLISSIAYHRLHQLWRFVCAFNHEFLSCPRNLCSTQSTAYSQKLPCCTSVHRNWLFPIYQTIRSLSYSVRSVWNTLLFYAFLDHSSNTPITPSAWEECCLLLPESSGCTGDNLHSPTVSCASPTSLLLSFLVCFCSVQRKLLYYLQSTAPSWFVCCCCCFWCLKHSKYPLFKAFICFKHKGWTLVLHSSRSSQIQATVRRTASNCQVVTHPQLLPSQDMMW